MRTLPAMGMRKGSVQKTALRARLSRLVLTAMESSMGSSGGMTLVMIMVQLSTSLKRLRSGSYICPHKTLLGRMHGAMLGMCPASATSRETRSCALRFSYL